MAGLWARKSGVANVFHSSASLSVLEVVANGSFNVGDIILVTVSAGSMSAAQSVVSISDQLGNSYSPLTNGTKNYDAGAGGGSSSGLLSVYAAVNVAVGVPDIKVGLFTPASYGSALAVEGFTGTSTTVDVSATPASGAASSAPSAGTSGATTNGNELAMAIYADQGGYDLLVAPSGYTAGATVSGTTDNNLIFAYKDSGSSGSTITAGNVINGGGNTAVPWAYVVVVLKPSVISASETISIADSASVSISSSTTPHTSDAQGIADRGSVATSPTPTTYAGTVLGDNPSVYWRLGEPSGLTAFDSSGNNRPGTISATGVTYSQAGSSVGDSNTSMALDGATGQISSVSVPNNFAAMEVWFKTTTVLSSGGQQEAILATEDTGSVPGVDMFATGRVGGSTLYFFLRWNNTSGFAAIESTAFINDGKWHHAVWTWDGTNHNVYLDGQSIGSTAAPQPITAGKLWCGAYRGTSNFYQGLVDEVACYIGPLSAAQVLAHYTAGITAPVAPSAPFINPAPSWTLQTRIPRYRFYLARLDSNIVMATLPLTEVSFSNLLNQAGTFSAKLPLSDRALVPDPDLAMSATQPEQTVLYIDKGGQIVHASSILTRSYDLASDTITIGGQDLWYWFSKRVIVDSLSYTNVDILQIMRNLVTYAQGQPQGSLGIAVDNTLNSGVTRTRNYPSLASGQAGPASIAVACQELAALNPGFEFRVRAQWVNGVPQRQLQLAYPHFGIPAASTQLMWSYPGGPIEAMTIPEDGTATARRVIALGNQLPDGTRQIATSAETIGFPLTDTTLSYSVDDAPSLQDFANNEQAARANPIMIPQVTVYGRPSPMFGTYHEGDHARYKVRPQTSGRYWTNGMDTVWRIVGLSVKIRQDGTEDVTHLLSAATF